MSVKEGGKTIHKPSCIINHEALRYCIYTGTDGVTVLVSRQPFKRLHQIIRAGFCRAKPTFDEVKSLHSL